MKNSLRKYAFPLVLLIALTAATISFVSAWSATRGKAEAKAASLGEAALAVTANGSSAQSETQGFTIRQNGIEPGELSRPAGAFNFRIENRSGVSSPSLRLTRSSGEQVLEYTIPPGVSDYIHRVDLQSGVYTLKEINHPTWLLQITVQ